MSERLGALSAMVEFDLARGDDYVADFYDRFSDEDLVIDSWFSVQARADSRDVRFIEQLMTREDYDWNTPNRVRSTLLGLAAKPTQLWTKEGIELFLTAIASLDALNPTLAARMVSSLSRWYTLGEPDKAMAKEALTNLQKFVKSKNVLESLSSIINA